MTTKTTSAPLEPSAAVPESPPGQAPSSGHTEEPAQHTERKDSQQPRHDVDATQTTAPTTVPPCPSWCTWRDHPAHAAGNDFEALNSGEGMVRNHEGPSIGVEPYSFLVSTEETMRRGVVETSPAYIYFHVEYERLTAPQMRDLGTLLLATADELDEINGAQ